MTRIPSSIYIALCLVRLALLLQHKLRLYQFFVSAIAGSNTGELAELESRHAAEVERLRSKLKWYAETQVLLDRDALTLKKKEEEINELKETVARLQAQHGQTVAEKKQRGMERATDAKRIQDLERQVFWRREYKCFGCF